MAYIGNGKVDGRIELGKMLQKRHYPKGVRAINNLKEYFENRLKTMYKDAPSKWKMEYTKAVFGGIEEYSRRVGGAKPKRRIS